MDIALDKVCELILRARAIDVKEGVTDPDSGSNPIDDGNLDSLANRFAYSERAARTLAVDVRAIAEALETVYEARELLRELGAARAKR